MHYCTVCIKQQHKRLQTGASTIMPRGIYSDHVFMLMCIIISGEIIPVYHKSLILRVVL